jgi:hypothetical protein
MSIGYNPSIATSGLVLCLDAANPRSYSGSGTTWKDISSGFNTTLSNGPTYTSGIGGYFTFDGVDDWVDIGTNAAFTPANFTASIWFYLNNTPSVGNQYRLFRSRLYGFGVSIDESRIYNSFVYTNTTGDPSLTGSALSLNTWYNITTTFISSTYSIYLNGNFVTSTGTATNSAYYVNGYLGLARDADSSNSYLNGRISQFQFYNRGLSAAEVSQNFNAFRGRYGI